MTKFRSGIQFFERTVGRLQTPIPSNSGTLIVISRVLIEFETGVDCLITDDAGFGGTIMGSEVSGLVRIGDGGGGG